MVRHHGARLVAFLMLLLLLWIGGCSRSGGTVSGKVKYKGQLLPSGLIVFYDSNERQIGTTSINADGSYSAMLPAGLLKIAVSTSATPDPRSLTSDQKKKIREKAKKMKGDKYVDPFDGVPDAPSSQKSITIPTKYADAVHSGLSLTVIGGPQTFDIDLQ